MLAVAILVVNIVVQHTQHFCVLAQYMLTTYNVMRSVGISYCAC